MPKLTAARLCETYSYDPETGVFTPIGPATKGRPRGNGSVTKGYRIICIDSVKYRANRLAWLYSTGNWPAGIVDHRNGDTLDNRFDNLRDVSHSLNAQNRQRPNWNKNGGLPLGVYRTGSTFEMRIRLGGVNHTKGGFATPEDAGSYYMECRRLFMAGNTL